MLRRSPCRGRSGKERRRRRVRGATVYVNLEPCCHQGQDAPMRADAIEKGVSRVVVGMTDPNPKVNCGGIKPAHGRGDRGHDRHPRKGIQMDKQGIHRRMNDGRPWVTLKTACSLDGKYRAEGRIEQVDHGRGLPLEGPHDEGRERRNLLSGIGTVLADDPAFTVREAEGRTPLRGRS
jgi:diaminohydroxyphosphoribosylaminopyrimidine deaminase/5-amino-6-(5-phosphoribosylamino)uracil reductase